MDPLFLIPGTSVMVPSRSAFCALVKKLICGPFLSLGFSRYPFDFFDGLILLSYPTAGLSLSCEGVFLFVISPAFFIPAHASIPGKDWHRSRDLWVLSLSGKRFRDVLALSVRFSSPGPC